MHARDFAQLTLFVGGLILITPPLGRFMVRMFGGRGWAGAKSRPQCSAASFSSHAMNFYWATFSALKRFTAPRIVEKRTYVFLLVPIDLRRQGESTTGEVEQHLIDRDDPRVRHDARPPICLTDLRAGIDGSAEPELDCDLMWTWFLPNPLWPPNEGK